MLKKSKEEVSMKKRIARNGAGKEEGEREARNQEQKGMSEECAWSRRKQSGRKRRKLSKRISK